MKFLVDESLSAVVARHLDQAGHDARHVGDEGLLGASDTEVMRAAHASGRVLVAADTDFGELLALGRHPGPSVILFRRAPASARRPGGLTAGQPVGHRRQPDHGSRISWQGLPANEWLTVIAGEVANRVEIPEFGGLSKGPGMFALMDEGETTALLETAGFTEVTFDALAPAILVGGGGTVDQSVDFLFGMGMVRGLIGLAGPDAQDTVVEAVRSSLTERYEPGVGVRCGAGAWMVTALAERFDPARPRSSLS